MASPILLNKTQTVTGLGTWDFTVPTTGFYNLKFFTNEVPTSSLVVTVVQNASTLFTSTTMAASQTHFEFKLLMNLTATDIVHVNLVSAAAIDNQLNTVKSTISIGDGY